ncbi:hypothetical protein GCM10029978_067350 [Actinoallomurus acanthiterrae]
MPQEMTWGADDPDRPVPLDDVLIDVTELDGRRNAVLRDESGNDRQSQRHRISDPGDAWIAASGKVRPTRHLHEILHARSAALAAARSNQLTPAIRFFNCRAPLNLKIDEAAPAVAG